MAAALDRLARRPGAGPPQPREPRLRARQQPRPRPRDRRRRRVPQQRHHRPAGLAGPAARRPRGRRGAGRPAAAALPERRRSSPRASRSPPAAGCRTRSCEGFPAEDAYGVEGLRFHALTGAALALRFADVVRAARVRPGLQQRHGGRRPLPPAGAGRAPATSGSSTAQPVVHHESRTPGRHDKHLANRAVYLDRWQGEVEPRDDADALGHPGHARGRPRRSARPGAARRRGCASRGRCWSARRGSRSARAPGCAGRSRTPRRPARAASAGATPTSPRRWRRRCATTARRWSSTGGPSGTGPPAATTTSSWCCAAWSATTRAPSRSRCSG